VEGASRFGRNRHPARLDDRCQGDVHVEDVMVDTSHSSVIGDPGLEVAQRSRGSIPVKIVKANNLLKVRIVALVDLGNGVTA
jgi:hypothetical protein